jgi:Domain of unknown function (DUF4189)
MSILKTLVITFAQICTVPACYAVGALARNSVNNDSAVVVNKRTKSDAIHDAMLACGSDCEIVVTFQNSCIAYAADHREKSTKYGYGQAQDLDRAGETALERCQTGGGSCTVMSSGCDGQ